MSDVVTYRHIAEADQSDEPFDWTEHTDGQDIDCFCQPRIEGDLVIHHREPPSTSSWWDEYGWLDIQP